MQAEIYTLPEVYLVGGATKLLRFNLKDANLNAFDASGCSANFAVVNYNAKERTPIFSVTPTFLDDESGITSVMLVELESIMTKTLDGMFIYQITIIDPDGRIGIPNQGILHITRNINQDYI